MVDFQRAPLLSCLKHSPTMMISKPTARPAAKLAGSPSTAVALGGVLIRAQGKARKRFCQRLNLCRQSPAISTRDGEMVGVKLPDSHVAPLLRSKRSNVDLAVLATASPMDIGEEASAPAQTQSLVEGGVDWLDAFHRFSRPHTVLGSAMGIISISLSVVQSPADLSTTFFVGLLQALIPALLMNIYIVGLNQIYDVEIDRINKPYLPLASGEFSMATGVAIVTTCAVLSVGIGFLVGSKPLLWTLLSSLFLGTAYSLDLPFLRWKRSALAAASCILAVRAIVVQLGFYYHMQEFVFQRVPLLTKQLAFATAFMSFFSLVIALAKDLPDVKGDKVYGIRSFSVSLGQRKVFWSCVWLIQSAYAVALWVGITTPSLLSKIAMIIGHTALSFILWTKAQATNLKEKSSIVSFYMFVWQLFYAEYIIIPFVR